MTGLSISNWMSALLLISSWKQSVKHQNVTIERNKRQSAVSISYVYLCMDKDCPSYVPKCCLLTSDDYAIVFVSFSHFLNMDFWAHVNLFPW